LLQFRNGFRRQLAVAYRERAKSRRSAKRDLKYYAMPGERGLLPKMPLRRSAPLRNKKARLLKPGFWLKLP
jgi:hypothetical protein